MVLFALLQHFAGLFSALMQLHGLLYLYILYRKGNIDQFSGHLALKKHLFARKCKEMKLSTTRTGKAINMGQ